MSSEEEKRCPLCAEEMDWTDQQFKPCKCGYQVCVWCWHHIIDMAEKDETEGRCPACRTIYDKEKIVAMQANFERTAVTSNSNRKNKPPKAKPKTIEVKKDLTNIRVIQRKMAYIIGLPLSLADEDVLQKKEYFGQYGKITKISLSRTAGGAIQQFVNDTCSVYVTYSKEEEALKCIQSVHGFVLEGRFLRASFGTAKYCHAWLKNMPCNNSACLYLHSIGADEDSFGKDEVAAVHTRNRVQQIAGATNSVQRRSGNVLPPPVDELSGVGNASVEKSNIRNGPTDGGHGSLYSNGHIGGRLPSTDKEGGVPNKSFVDIVGRSNNYSPEKDRNISEDRRILNLCSNLSSATIDRDIHVREPYADSMLFKVSSSSQLLNRLPSDKDSVHYSDKPFREHQLPFEDKRLNSNRLTQQTYFLNSSYPSRFPENSAYPFTHKKAHSLGSLSWNNDAVNNHEDEASLPITCVNRVLSDGFHETRFQSSAKSDRIYRNSNSFSNEEIVEHLRRIDDDNFANNDESFAQEAVESSIISNIMSMDFDSCDDSMALPHRVTGLLDETDGPHGSSWNSNNSDLSVLPFLKQDGFVSQVADMDSLSNISQLSSKGPVLQDFVGSKEHYVNKSQFQVSRPQNLVPPGFSVPCRDPPPGFSAIDRKPHFAHASSGNNLVNGSSALLNSVLQMSSAGSKIGSGDVDFLDPAILSCSKGKPTNVVDSTGFDVRSGRAPQLSAFEDEAKLWLLMEQQTAANQAAKYSQNFVSQIPSTNQESRYPKQVADGVSTLDDIYGFSSRLRDQRQSYDPSPYTQLSQQKFPNGHISNGYQQLDEVKRRNEAGSAELQRNEKLGGVDKYFQGYGDMMVQVPSSGDVYTRRVFGM